MTEELAKHWRQCAFQSMFIAGLCATSTSVVVSILQQQWDLSYSMTGTMLSMVVVGNITASFLVGVLSQIIGERMANLILSTGSCLGYLILIVTGQPVWLCAGFLIIGLAKGTTLNTGTVLVKRSTDQPTRSVNLAHGFYATGGLVCPFVIAMFGWGPWWLPMAALSVIGIGHVISFMAAKLPSRPDKVDKKRGEWGFLRQPFFWVLTATLFFECGSEQAVTSWVVSYFKSSGILTGFYADLTVTVVWGAMLLARLAIAFLIQFQDSFKALIFMVLGCLVTYGGLLAAPGGFWALGALFLFGLAVAGANPTLIASGGSYITPTALGVMIATGCTGAVIMPYLVGVVAEGWGMTAGMACPLVGFVAMLILLCVCRKMQPKEN